MSCFKAIAWNEEALTKFQAGAAGIQTSVLPLTTGVTSEKARDSVRLLVLTREVGAHTTHSAQSGREG